MRLSHMRLCRCGQRARAMTVENKQASKLGTDFIPSRQSEADQVSSHDWHKEAMTVKRTLSTFHYMKKPMISSLSYNFIPKWPWAMMMKIKTWPTVDVYQFGSEVKLAYCSVAHWLILWSTKGAKLGIQCQRKNTPGSRFSTGSGVPHMKMTAHQCVLLVLWFTFPLIFLHFLSKLHLNSSPFHSPLPLLSPLFFALSAVQKLGKKVKLGVWTWHETHGLTAWAPLVRSLQAFSCHSQLWSGGRQHRETVSAT